MRIVLAVMLALACGRSSALAWGCDGHRAIAILAERYAKPAAVAAAKALLAAHPIDPALSRFCGPFPGDPIVDAATWADDYRNVDQSTAPWHFIDFPLAVADATSHYTSYCPSARSGSGRASSTPTHSGETGCVIDAIVPPFAIARTSSNAEARATALRYLIHLIGDAHQPLHAIANGDRGGNCVPVTYFGQAPQVDANGNYSPNLHGIWDSQSVRRLMEAVGAATPSALATNLDPHASPSKVHAEMPSTARVVAWTTKANAFAKSTAYGKLSTPVPVEPASQFMIASCDDNNHVAQRMAALDERLDAQYDAAARPVIRTQLRDGARRLAATIDALFQ